MSTVQPTLFTRHGAWFVEYPGRKDVDYLGNRPTRHEWLRLVARWRRETTPVQKKPEPLPPTTLKGKPERKEVQEKVFSPREKGELALEIMNGDDLKLLAEKHGAPFAQISRIAKIVRGKWARQ